MRHRRPERRVRGAALLGGHSVRRIGTFGIPLIIWLVYLVAVDHITNGRKLDLALFRLNDLTGTLEAHEGTPPFQPHLAAK